MFVRLKPKNSVIFWLVALLAAVAAGASQIVLADTGTQAIAEGYSSNTPLQLGMIVRLDKHQPTYVVPLEQNNIKAMLGVVVSASDEAITLGTNSTTQQVFVTNFGQHNVLVTNQNGPIKVGDYITISNLSGVGMKADESEPIVLGQAAGNFDGVNNVLSTSVLISGTKKKTNVSVGSIPVDISIGNNPLAQGPKGLPAFLYKITKFATNKSVSATRVYISMLIVVAGVLLSVTIIYSGVKSGIISLGRNPLAKKAISGSLVRVVLAGIMVFAISLGAAYAVLL